MKSFLFSGNHSTDF